MKRWEQDPGNPIITFGQAVPGMVWNDPSVIKENGQYRMWMSGGIPSLDPVVEVYTATSADGLSWNIETTPVLPVSAAPAWDDHRIETPAVVKVGSVYHLYYSACGQNGGATDCASGRYMIGHATSTDGRTWTRDSANPVLRDYDTLAQWGSMGIGEPAAFYDPVDDVIWVYFTVLKQRVGYTGDLALYMGVSAAASLDGTNFQVFDPDNNGYPDVVWTQSAAYPVSAQYVGPSTPMAFVDSTRTFHLFYDMAAFPAPGQWRQVAIAHAAGPDALTFTEVETNIVTAFFDTWTNWESRSPWVIEDGNVFKMWFAGHGGNNDWSTAGIGYAVYGANCP